MLSDFVRVACKHRVCFEGRDDGSVNTLTHLMVFCFTGKFCRSCLPAIKENEKSYCFLVHCSKAAVDARYLLAVEPVVGAAGRTGRAGPGTRQHGPLALCL